jgi:hypothetical protein
MRVQTSTKNASWQRRFRAAGFVAITLAGASFPLAGSSAPDAATEDVSQALMSGQAWEAFCERLKETAHSRS